MAGGIYSEQAYAQGKMLDHSSWEGELPRGITPSDVDCVFDNKGNILIAEYSRHAKVWGDLDYGQMKVYDSFVLRGEGSIVAALCNHNVPTDRQINTRNDVEVFQLMWRVKFDGNYRSELWPGALWARFVSDFYAKDYEKWLLKRKHP